MAFLHRVADDIRVLKDLLKRYDFGQDGRAIYKEIIQNADDGGASTLQIHLMERGFDPSEVHNPLLTGPALVTVNDGAFRRIDAENMQYATGTSKSRDIGTVGRFGLGQKSVFHLCEAWFCMGSSTMDGPASCNMNPWEHPVHGDPDFPAWNGFSDHDQDVIRSRMKPHLGGSDWFILWLPLRLRSHRRGLSGVINEWYPEIAQLRDHLTDLSSLGDLLPQMGKLRYLEVFSHRNPGETVASARVGLLPGSTSLSRPTNNEPLRRTFSGKVQTTDGKVSTYTGIERVSLTPELREVREHENWPKTVVDDQTGPTEVEELIVPHGAVTIVIGEDSVDPFLGVHWCVFLPMADESFRLPMGRGARRNVTVKLHGYFFPDHGRRQITGLMERSVPLNNGHPDFEAEWNRRLRDGVVLPCLIPAIYEALKIMGDQERITFVEAIRHWPAFNTHQEAICSDLALVRGFAPGDPFEVVPITSRLLPVPACTLQNSRPLRQHLARAEHDGARLVLREGPHLVPDSMPQGWTMPCLSSALASPIEECLDDSDAVVGLADLIAGLQEPSLKDIAAAELLRRALRRHGPKVFTAARLVDPWKRIVACLATTGVLATREPSALSLISQLNLAVIVLPTTIVDKSTAQISLDDGRQILEILSQVIQGVDLGPAEAAGLLAAEVVGAMGAQAVLRDDRLRVLPVFRVWSARAREHRNISAGRLLELRATGLAFSGSGIVRPHEAATALFSALSDGDIDVVLADDTIADPLDLPKITELSLLRPLIESRNLSIQSAASNRRSLLSRVLTPPALRALQANEPTSETSYIRFGIRFLLHGNGTLRRTDDQLWKSGDIEGLEHEAVRLVLGIKGDAWRLISAELTQELNEQWMRVLGVRSLGRHELLEVLGELSPDDLAKVGKQASDSASICLLRLTTERQNLWMSLPLHRTTDGRRVAVVSGRSWLDSPSWQLPKSLSGVVDRIDISRDKLTWAAQQQWIKPWSPAAQVDVIMRQDQPWKWAMECLDALFDLETSLWPAESLADKEWLPTRRTGFEGKVMIAAAPACVLDLAPEAALHVVGIIGGLASAFIAPTDVSETAREHPVFPEIIRRFALRGDDLVQALAMELNDLPISSLAIGEDGQDVPFEPALRSQGLSSHPGWSLIRVLHGEMPTSSSLQTDLVQALSRPMPDVKMVDLLNALADAAERAGNTGSTPENIVYPAYLAMAAKRPSFSESVLPHIRLPNRAFRWVNADKVARSGDNWAVEYRLPREIQEIVEPALDQIPATSSTMQADTNVQAVPSKAELETSATTLEQYFDPLFRHQGVRQEAAGLLVSLLGRGFRGQLVQLADAWMSPIPAESMWDWMLHKATKQHWNASDGDHVRLADSQYAVRVVRPENVYVHTVSLLGTPLEAKLATGKAVDTIFAGLDSQAVGTQRPYCLRLLEVDDRLVRESVTELLRRSIEEFATKRLLRSLSESVFEPRWKKFSESGQVQLSAVRQQILENLATRLEVLSYKRNPALAEAVSDLMRSRQRAAEAETTFADSHWAEKLTEPREAVQRAQGHLVHLVETDGDVQAFLLDQMRHKLTDYQYGPDRVLWELIQNADDAVVQLLEMTGDRTDCGDAVRRLRVEVQPGQVRVTHWGRQINQHTGYGFHDGRSRGWDLDLLNMMVLNTSDKSPDQGTTGCFGLGFKSTYLVSDRPRVGSGQLAFEVVAGMLPNAIGQSPVRSEEWSLLEPPTVIELDLRSPDFSKPILEGLEVFGGLAPVFCRAINEIELSCSGFRATARWRPVPLPGVPGMLAGVQPLGLRKGAPTVRLLVVGDEQVEIVFMLTDGRLAPMPQDIPTLWCTAPTKEQWDLGFVVNGPIAVDTGRSRVALDRIETQEVISRAGRLIASAFSSLHSALTDNWGEVAELLGMPTTRSDAAAQVFWGSVWDVLAKARNSVRSADEIRAGLARRLHGGTNGLSGLTRRKPVLPTCLPEPFNTLTQADRVRYAVEGELEEPTVLSALRSWTWIDPSFLPGSVIAQSVIEVLRVFDTDLPGVKRVGLVDLLKKWGNKGGTGIDRERAVELHVLVDWLDDTFMRTQTRDELKQWLDGLFFPSQGRQGASGSRLLLPPLEGKVADELRVLHEGDRLRKLEDEFLRAKFAPSDNVLSADVASDAKAVRFFLACRRLQAGDTGELERWARDAQMPGRQEAALWYCVHGEYGHALSMRFRQDPLPWFSERGAVARSSLLSGWKDADKVDLQNALFPQPVLDPVVVPQPAPFVEPQQTVERFFDKFQSWWNDAATRQQVIADYEARAWPGWLRPGLADALHDDSPEHWLALLVLGACRSIGMAENSHHRGFLEAARNEGWWEVFQDARNDVAWMEMLRKWQDEAVSKLDYARWMGLFPAIYQLSRYLLKYERLLTAASHRPSTMYQIRVLLAPRADENLTGAGQNFDAPPAPLNMGLHWVLRELVRMKVIEAEPHVLPDCWVPSSEVISFLRKLGLDAPDGIGTNPEKAKAIHDFLAHKLSDPNPHLHHSFDIPIRHVAGNAALRERFGLED